VTKRAIKVATASDQLPPSDIGVGQWCWVAGGKKKGERWFGCVTRVGSNYVKLKSGQGHSQRVHFADFWKQCEPVDEAAARAVIDQHIAEDRVRLDALVHEVKRLTASLAIGPNPALHGAGETQAMVVATEGRSYTEYSTALTRAKKESLPKLFEQMKETTASMAAWMSAQVVPLKAQADGLKGVIAHIDQRIFNVQLYAGLVEQLVQVRDGDPAELTTPVHLLQRRHYMDEECLARYQTGGMELKNIAAFERWLLKKEQFERLLPFPRCVLAFRVRRHHKDRAWPADFGGFLKLMDDRKDDEATFLYIRNGAQLWRLRTAIEFDEKLFPDTEREALTGKLWAYAFMAPDFDKLVTDREYQAMLAAARAEDAEAKAEYDAAPKKDKWRFSDGRRVLDLERHWYPFDRSTVYFDDIAKFVQRTMDQHNRIALILQGLLDRSPCLHPHPPWQLYTDEGYGQAVVLVYDQTRALVSGAAPDFEAYRAKLNASLTEGSITVGQDRAWELAEGAKEYERMSRSRGGSHHEYLLRGHRPYGNPGPGKLAHVAEYAARTQKCTYRWERGRSSDWSEEKRKVGVRFSCPAKDLLNVSAYTPGDFHLFFDDPRTRADYLQWAPLLLEAEEYHAGNREVRQAMAPKPKPASSWEGRKRYERQRQRKLLQDKAVRNRDPITTKSGKEYPAGMLWRVVSTVDGFAIAGITKDGRRTDDDDGRYVHGMHFRDLQIDSSIPSEPDK
jgi:hypothetical protein